MNIDTRNKILSAVFGITIILLSWVLYDSIVTPYKVVEEQKAETERVRTRMLTLKLQWAGLPPEGACKL